MRVSGPSKSCKRLLLRYTGHSRQHALCMMVMAVMEVQHAHLHFRVASDLAEVNQQPPET
jgi:hypothetical protein